MDEKPKSIWKKSFTGRTAWVIWLALAVFTTMLGSFIIALTNQSQPMSDTFMAWGIFAGGFLVVCLALIYIVWPLLRWLFWKHWRRTLFALACLITLIALFYAEENWRGKRAWEKFKHEWEAKGERFDYASVVPPPVPDDQNFAMTPIMVESMKAVLGPKNSSRWFGNNYAENGRTNFADRLAFNIFHDEQTAMPKIEKPKLGNRQKDELSDLRAWQNYYRIPGFTNQLEKQTPFNYPAKAFTNGFPTAPQPQTPAQDVLLALSKYDPAIEELRQASLLPYSRFPVYADADHPFDTLLPHLADLKRCAQTLQLRAIAELQNGQSDKALADVKLALRLADSVRTEPFLISHLVRAAIFQITLQPIYEGLAAHQWSDIQLAELNSQLAKLDYLADYELTMRGERASSVSTLDYIRRTRDLNGVDNFTGSKPAKRFQQVFSHLTMPDAFFYQNELTMARMHQQYTLPMVDMEKRTVSPARVQKLQTESRRDLNYHWWPYKFFARMLFPAVENAVKKLVYAQTSVDLARVAIALERYRLARGEYPESLDVLGPQFIDKVPHDVIGGQPLKYRREANGQFTLYSVGWNETDDGGVVVFKKGSTPEVDTDKGDWVWRYPAN
jgi:hypothetical protein